MRFSVISGIYNGKLAQLEEAIQSVLSQSLSDFEWLICDDGSREPVRSFLREAASRDRRIRLLVNQQNRGLAYSLNRCIRAASTPILLRQDGDDRSSSGRFERLVPFMEQHPEYALVSSNISLFDDGGKWGRMRYPEFPSARDFLFCVPFMHGAVGMRRDAVLQAGGYCVSRVTRRCEDLELFFRLYAAGECGYTIQEELYEYREDVSAAKRRKYRYRLEEALVKYRGFRDLGLLPGAFPYVCKPLVAGLLPAGILNRMKDRYYGRRG